MRQLQSKFRNQAGFSLMEMVVVTAITATLAVVGVPKYQSFLATAKQSEAKNNLAHIYTLQGVYMDSAGQYGTLAKTGGSGGKCDGDTGYTNDIHFLLKPCATAFSDKVRYAYTSAPANSPAFDQFDAAAESGTSSANFVSGCATADKWSIDENRDLVAVKDTSRTCP